MVSHQGFLHLETQWQHAMELTQVGHVDLKLKNFWCLQQGELHHPADWRLHGSPQRVCGRILQKGAAVHLDGGLRLPRYEAIARLERQVSREVAGHLHERREARLGLPC